MTGVAIDQEVIARLVEHMKLNLVDKLEVVGDGEAARDSAPAVVRSEVGMADGLRGMRR